MGANVEVMAKKSFYKFQDLVDLIQVKPYVMRFWESEFEQINPVISETGQKYYTPKDLEVIKNIKLLLVEQKVPMQKAKIELDKNFPSENEYKKYSEPKKNRRYQETKKQIHKSGKAPIAVIKAKDFESVKLGAKTNIDQKPILIKNTESPQVKTSDEEKNKFNQDIADVKNNLNDLLSLIRSYKSEFSDNPSSNVIQ
jgi:DNA-binding transcriptional MerR regulator